MKSYQELIKKCLTENREKVEMLQAYEPVIRTVNDAVAEYENEEGIESIGVAYPTFLSDYLLVSIYLSEKGAIGKDIGSFLDELYACGLERSRDTFVKAKEQQKYWYLHHLGICYKSDTGTIYNPVVQVQVDAIKSQTCKRVETGEMVPVYEFVCEEE